MKSLISKLIKGNKILIRDAKIDFEKKFDLDRM